MGRSIQNPNENQSDFLKYVHITNPLDLKVKREEVFYRDCFSDIIDYIKFILNPEAFSSNFDFITIKGSILLNSLYGTDLTDYLKLLAKTYTLNHIELNFSEIHKSPDDFISKFPDIIRYLSKKYKDARKDEEDLKEDKKIIERALAYLVVIDDNEEVFERTEQNFDFDLFERLYYEMKTGLESLNFIENGIILIGINHNEEKLRQSSLKYFDFYLKIPRLSENQRKLFLEKLQEKITENWNMDVNRIASLTEGWEVEDLRNLINIAIIRNASKLENSSENLTELIENIIENGEFLPANLITSTLVRRASNLNNISKIPVQFQNQDQQIVQRVSTREITDKVAQSEGILQKEIEKIKSQRISDFMVKQLYEEAASEKYTELIILLDKIKKEEPLEDYDKKLLAEYSFILNDPPNIALISLEKAKKRIDNIKKAFGKG